MDASGNLRRPSVPEPHDESVSVFDAEGRAVGALPRAQAKRSRLAVGAVNVLLVSAGGEVLLQRRPEDKENGGRWDKTVGGHVDEGESFDEAAVREAGEELFGDGASPRVRLARDEAELSSPPRDGRPLAGGRLPAGGAPAQPARRAARAGRPGDPQRDLPRGELPRAHRRAARRLPAPGRRDRGPALRRPGGGRRPAGARRACSEHGVPLAHPRPRPARTRGASA